MTLPRTLTADHKIISPLHRRLLRIIAEAEREYGTVGLRLEGGTALAAYHLHHRESEDLDVFGDLALNARDFRRFLEAECTQGGLHVVAQGPASPGTAELFVSDQAATVPPDQRQTIKIQICRNSPFTLEPPSPTSEGLPVASYRDLCAGKLHAICDRFEARDFLDLHFVLSRVGADASSADESERRRRFRRVLADLEASDPGLNEVRVGQALARALGQPIVSAFPLRLVVRPTEEEVQETLRVALDECARVATERARWDPGQQRETPG